MPRPVRRESASSIYHIVTRGTSRQIVFEDDDDRRFFMSRATRLLGAHHGELLAWCLMDNHVHLLVRIPFAELSSFMGRLLGAYAGYFNRVHGRTGALFEGRFRSEPVDTEAYLLSVVRYIHRNPVKGGLSRGLAYPWSSYLEYLGTCGWSRPAFVLGFFGSLEEFCRFHEEGSGGTRCLDVEAGPRRKLSDREALRVAEELVGKGAVGAVKSFPRARRDAVIVELRHRGVSARQVQRLTGLSLGVISRAGRGGTGVGSPSQPR